jgi:hypothetical protein
LAEFVAFLEADTIPFSQANRWTLGDAYIALTGDVRNLIQVWRVPRGIKQPQATALLSNTRWGKLVPPNEPQVLDPTPFDVHFPNYQN